MVQSPPDNAPPRTACAGHQAPRARFHLRDHPSRRLRGQCAPADRLRAQAGSHRRRAQARAGDRRVHRLRLGRAHQRGLRRRRADAGRVLRAPVRAIRRARPAGTTAPPSTSSPRPRACTPAASMAMPSPTRSSARSSRPSAPTWASRPWYTAAAPRRSHPRDGKVYTSVLKPVGRSVSCAAWIPTARSCANPRWNRRRRTKSTPPSP